MKYKRQHLTDAIKGMDADEAVLELLDFIISLKEDDRLEIRGFGTFERKRTPQAKRRNPYSGGKLIGPSFSTIRFKPSKTVRLP
jgi:integration host factor subunit beta